MHRGDAVVLRSFSYADVLDVNDLCSREYGPLFVLTMPDGALELRETQPDEVLLWAFSSLLNLVESCGGGQPYVRAEAGQLADFARRLDKHTLAAVDMWHPDGARYSEPDVRDMEPLQLLEPQVLAALSVVWIPTRPVAVGDREVEVELHPADGAGPLLAVFTSMAALRRNCGPHQPASAIQADSIEKVATQAGAAGIAVDPMLAEGARHLAPEPAPSVPDRFGWEDDDDV